MRTTMNLATLFVIAGLMTGCTISRNVMPVDSGVTINKVYVLENERVHMDELVTELVTQIEQLGFESESYQGDRPDGAQHYLTYTANWSWDMAMYLTYFEATLYDDGKVLGEVEYDARSGGANMNKFGSTASKIQPLLKELFMNVERAPSSSSQ